MARGGKRDGAGRKAGVPNKATAELQAEVAASGLTPLDYMLQVMRDENKSADVRLDAANKAAPYVHPKLAAVEHSGKIETDNAHHGAVTIRPFADFIAGALGPGAESVSR
jgi:hypothetical protein